MEFKYVCRKHPDQVLFVEDADKMKAFIFEDQPKECTLCKRYYFKEECNQLIGGGGSGRNEL